MARLPDFEAWAIFAQVAEHGSFAKVAQTLGLSRPTVSRAVSRLEERLGVALFQRTSRQLSLTAAGQHVLEHASRLLREGRAAEEALQEQAGPPRGMVRMTMPVTFGLRHVTPILPNFMAEYPDITLDVDFSDHPVDLVAQGYDLALRISVLVDSSLRMRHVCNVPRFLVASPTWVAHRGMPEHPRDLGDDLNVVYQQDGVSSSCLRLHRDNGETATLIPRRPRMMSNNADAFLPFLETGGGVGLLPAFMADHSLQDGRLVRILPQWQSEEVALHVLTPPNAQRPARVAVFVEWLVRHLKQSCWARAHHV